VLAQSEWPRKQADPHRRSVSAGRQPTTSPARAVGEALSKLVGQAVIIDNRPGAAGGDRHVKWVQGAPDGYTYAVMSDSVKLLNFHAQRHDLGF